MRRVKAIDLSKRRVYKQSVIHLCIPNNSGA